MTTKIKGFTPVSDKLIQELGLICAAVYGKVWRYCDNFGKCTASKARIADELGLSERTVFNHLQELEKNQYIKIVHRTGETSIITVTNKITYETAVQELHGGQALDAEGAGNRCMGGMQEMPEGGALDADKDTNEDSKQDSKQEQKHGAPSLNFTALQDTYTELTGQTYPSNPKSWIEAFKAMDEAGILPEDLKAAHGWKSEKGYNVKSPSLLHDSANHAKLKRTGELTDNKKEPRRKKERIV
jgi:predicted transcriptional regulator